MVAPYKIDKVKEIKAKIEGREAIFLANFQGVSVNDLRDIRVELRNLNSSFEVVKNRLFKLAAKDVVDQFPDDVLIGNTAMVICNENIVDTAKVLNTSSRAHKSFELKGGFLKKDFLSKEKVVELASLPTKPELVGQLAGLLVSPIRRIMNVCNGKVKELAVVLSQISKQKEETSN